MLYHELMVEHEWAWDAADAIITKFNRMKLENISEGWSGVDDVDLLKMIAEALVEAKGG